MSEETKKPSEEFERAVLRAGSAVINCELCGRVNFCETNDYDYSEGELGRYRAEAEKHPDKYFEHDSDSISWGMIDNKQAVIGCPCNKLFLYEDLFWKSRYIIADYFKMRTQGELKGAKKEEAQVGNLKVE